MRLPSVIAFTSLFGSAFALTDDDLTPKALAGKTLTFAIEEGAPPVAPSGVWTGTFQSFSANGFIIRNVSGNTAAANRTCGYLGYDGGHVYRIEPLVPGQPASTLTLWASEATPRYSVILNGSGGFHEVGRFSIGESPEIVVQQPTGNDLADNKIKKSFGSVKVGQTGITKTFTIRNAGNAKLTGLAISKSGENSSEFIVTGLKTRSLAPGKAITFKVKFKPTSSATKKAVIKIASSDSDESPFDVKVTGKGVAK